MALIFRNQENQLILKLSTPIDYSINFKIFILGESLTEINHSKINDSFLIHNNLFQIERFLLSLPNDSTIHINASENNFKLTENLQITPSLFKPLIDYATPNQLPPFFYATYSKPSQLAIFTHIYNEDLFLKIFIKYYSKLVDFKDIYVIDHGSNLYSYEWVKNLGCQVIKIPKGLVDQLNVKKYCEYFQRFLLTQYNWVLHADVDELLIHKNGVSDLKELINNSNKNIIIKPNTGVELIENPIIESKILIEKNISLQRKFYRKNEVYAKPVLSSISCTWGLGFHYSIGDDKVETSNDLILVHLAYISIEETLRRNLYWKNSLKGIGDAINVNQESRPTTLAEVKEYFKKLLEEDLIYVNEWTFDQF